MAVKNVSEQPRDQSPEALVEHKPKKNVGDIDEYFDSDINQKLIVPNLYLG